MLKAKMDNENSPSGQPSSTPQPAQPQSLVHERVIAPSPSFVAKMKAEEAAAPPPTPPTSTPPPTPQGTPVPSPPPNPAPMPPAPPTPTPPSTPPPSPPPATVSPPAGSPPASGAVVYTDPTAPKPTPTSNKRLIRILLYSGIGVGAVCFILLLVLWILPSIWANSYLSTIKPLYTQQTTAMQGMYRSMYLPVFTINGTGESTNQTQLSEAQQATQQALSATNALAAKDHLTVIPGSTWIHSVSRANGDYQAMQQYVSGSQQVISNYTTLITYIQGLIKIEQTKLPPLLNDFNQLNTNPANESHAALVSTLLTILQTTTANLQSFTQAANALKPSADLQQFQSDLLNDLSSMQSSLQVLISALQGNVSSAILNALGEFNTSSSDFNTLLSSKPTTGLPTSSLLHSQIVVLQGENPVK